jgi:hypothetical protein
LHGGAEARQEFGDSHQDETNLIQRGGNVSRGASGSA